MDPPLLPHRCTLGFANGLLLQNMLLSSQLEPIKTFYADKSMFFLKAFPWS